MSKQKRKLTAAQQALAELLQVPQELLAAAAQHSTTGRSANRDDFPAWVERLPQARRSDYLMRLARNEPGLNRLLVKELRTLGQEKTSTPSAVGEWVKYATLVTESLAIQARLEQEEREQAQLARQRHLQDIHDHQEVYWRQLDQTLLRSSGSAYDEATQLLVELRDAADQFAESREFHTRFRTWVRTYTRRPAFIKRLQDRKFALPDV